MIATGPRVLHHRIGWRNRLAQTDTRATSCTPKRAIHKRTTPPETVTGVTLAAIRYFRYSPPIRTRSALVMFFASGLLALLPSLSHTVKSSPTAYGLLMGCFGFGAVVGALLMQRARARWSTEVVVTGGVALFGIATLAASLLRSLAGLSVAMIVGGSSWIVFLSLFSVLVLNHAPEWVRARVLVGTAALTEPLLCCERRLSGMVEK